jgi:hypothetical protein
MGRALFRLLTWLSLLASVGSFVIVALPVVNNFQPKNGSQEYSPQLHHEEQRLMAPQNNETNEHDFEERIDMPWAEWRAQMIRAGLWVIAFCATGLAIIRLIRREQRSL